MKTNDFISTPITGGSALLPYVSPTPGRFPVLCSSVYVDNKALTDTMTQEEKIAYLRRILEEARECGIDMGGIDAHFKNSTDMSKNDLSMMFGPAAKNTGVGFFINNGAMKGYNSAHYDDYLKYALGLPCVKGLNLPDEQDYDQFFASNGLPGPLSNEYLTLAAKMRGDCDELKQPLRQILMNLSPKADVQKTGTGNNYMQYLSALNNAFHPMQWSFDQYQYRIEKYYYQGSTWSGATFKFDSEQFYELLGCYWQISKETKRPFKYIALSTEYSNSENYTPQPTINRMQYATFTALAYGAQEIQFFTYSQRDPSNGEIFSLSPVNRIGRKNELWYTVKKISDEIRRYARVFLGSKVFYFQHIVEIKGITWNSILGSYATKYGAPELTAPDNLPIKDIHVTETVLNLENKLHGVLVSYLYNNPDDTYANPRPSGTSVSNSHASLYIVIVSHDPDNYKKVRIEFNESAKPIIELTPVNPVDAMDSGSTSITRTLEPGGYLIFKYSGPFPTTIW